METRKEKIVKRIMNFLYPDGCTGEDISKIEETADAILREDEKNV